MSVDVTTSAVINAPRAVVAEYAADPSNAPKWYVNINSVEWVTAPPVALGTQVAFVAKFLGREMRYTYEFVEYEPGTRLVMRTAQGPFPMETSYTWVDEAAGATRMTLRNRGEPHGFGKLTVPLVLPAMRRANRKDLDRLKHILERPTQ